MVYELKPLCLALSEAIESIHEASHAIDYYGGHGDDEAMRRIFARVALVRMALRTFDKKHGKTL